MDCIEGIYRDMGWAVKNFHREDRRHERGIDLLCTKKDECVAFAVKKKPGQADITQLETFLANTKGMLPIYVYVNPPTRPFQERLEELQTNLEVWDSDKLHEELIYHESIPYLCFYFSAHPLFKNLIKIVKIIHEKRSTKCPPHEISPAEASTLWTVKDDCVKANYLLKFTHKKWAKTLMEKTEKHVKGYLTILDDVFEDLEIVNALCGEKIVSSFLDLSKKYPHVVGHYWEVVSHRTGWTSLIHSLEDEVEEANVERIVFDWIFRPRLPVMRDFYSSINHILEGFYGFAENIEDGLDWVFEDLIKMKI